MAKWMIAAKKADFDEMAKQYGISPVLARILRNRDLVEEEQLRKFLHGTAADFYDPSLLKGLEQAVRCLLTAVSEQKKIRIIGDYDADGICAAYILWKGLTALGAQADTVIPHRIRDGYGLNRQLVEQAARDGAQLLLTCDNGIAAAQEIAYARELGLQVVVTDHHEVPYTQEGDGSRRYLLPPAEAVVDPKQEGDGYPWPNICGAAVAWKLVQVLWEQGDPAEQEGLDELLQFAAFATVCDVMELRDENRILVKEGLARMRRTQNLGLHALMEVNGIDPEKLTAYQIGFVLGPCLNAAGRLDTAARGLELLQAATRAEAVRQAAELKQLNDSRKAMTEDFVRQACEQVENGPYREDRVLVLYLPDCHESLAGIIAGRVREKYYRPVFVLTKGEEGLKGSGRSIEGYHMYEEMTRHRELFTKYGGHRLAAGLSLPEENREPFRRAMNESCTLTPEQLEETVHIDVPVPFGYVTEAFVEELALLEPFGPGNPKPVFARSKIRFLRGRVMGKNGNAARFTVLDEGGRRYELVYFGEIGKLRGELRESFGAAAEEELFGAQGAGPRQAGEICLSVAYYPSFNTYKGRRELQLVMTRYQIAGR